MNRFRSSVQHNEIRNEERSFLTVCLGLAYFRSSFWDHSAISYGPCCAQTPGVRMQCHCWRGPKRLVLPRKLLVRPVMVFEGRPIAEPVVVPPRLVPVLPPAAGFRLGVDPMPAGAVPMPVVLTPVVGVAVRGTVPAVWG